MLRHKKLFLFDLDGTVYLGNKPLEGAVHTLDLLRRKGKQVCFVTNNSSKTRTEYLHKLNSMGIPAKMEEIFTSSLAAITLLKRDFAGQSVYLLATDLVKQEFLDAGINLVDDHAQICLMAYDTTLTYQKLVDFNRQIAKGAIFAATHMDNTCPHKDVYVPDCGSFAALFATSCNKTPQYIFGKPYTYMAQAVCSAYNVRASEVVFCGDRMHTDVLFAHNGGFFSVLVLSGESNANTPQAFDYKPNLVLENINGLRTLIG